MDYYMLTTTDNPFSPVTQHDAWLAWDLANHNSYALLGRVAYTSVEMSQADQDQALQDAINVIVDENVSGVHTKVKVDAPESNSETVNTTQDLSSPDA